MQTHKHMQTHTSKHTHTHTACCSSIQLLLPQARIPSTSSSSEIIFLLQGPTRMPSPLWNLPDSPIWHYSPALSLHSSHWIFPYFSLFHKPCFLCESVMSLRVRLGPRHLCHPHLVQGLVPSRWLIQGLRRGKGKLSRNLGHRQEPRYILVSSWEPERTQHSQWGNPNMGVT